MMSSNITIEMVDSVFERVPGATYAEAKEALVMCNGDVIEAVIYLENKKNTILYEEYWIDTNKQYCFFKKSINEYYTCLKTLYTLAILILARYLL